MQLLIEAEKKFGGGWGLYDPLGAKLKRWSVFVFFFFFLDASLTMVGGWISQDGFFS